MQGLALPRGLWILRDKSVMEREMEKKGVPAQTPGDSPTIPSICDWQARRLTRFNSLINFINHLLLNSGTQISPWALSGPPAEHTQPACPHALWHTGHTQSNAPFSPSAFQTSYNRFYIYINQLGLHVYSMSFSPLGVGMIQKKGDTLIIWLLMNINYMTCSD